MTILQNNTSMIYLLFILLNNKYNMKLIFLNSTILIIGFVFFACDGTTFGGIEFYNDFKVENKMDTTITIHLVADNEKIIDFLYTIPSGTSKSIVFSSVGNGEGYSPYNYKLIIVNYRNSILKDTLEDGNSLRNLFAYKELKESTYKKKKLNTFVFTIDSTYVNEHLK